MASELWKYGVVRLPSQGSSAGSNPVGAPGRLLLLVDNPCTRSFAMPSNQGSKPACHAGRLENAQCVLQPCIEPMVCVLGSRRDSGQPFEMTALAISPSAVNKRF